VLLGAESLDDALSALDGLGRVAALDGTILHQVRETRGEVRRALDGLRERQDEVRALVAEAAAERDELAAARRARSDYVARLAAERVLAERTIVRLTARAAAAGSSQPAPVPPPAGSGDDPAPAPAPAPAPGPTGGGTTMTVSSTGYCLRGTTSTGIPTGWGVVAVDPAVIPLGTRMSIPGYGEGVAADTGSAVRGAMIDVWFPSCSQALAWGRRVVTITLL
jgi:cystine transport system substrate-binding protein